MDALKLIPKSIIDDKMKEAMLEVSKVVSSLQEKFSDLKVQHPLLVNLALMRLYRQEMNKSETIQDSGNASDEFMLDCTLDDEFISTAMHYLRHADAIYETRPYVSHSRDILVEQLLEGQSSNVCLPRYAVYFDHMTKTIVVAIRGTVSLSDCLTDVIVDAVPFPEGGEGLFAHQGISQSAKLMLPLVLEAIDRAKSMRGGLYSKYDLVVTGHSLGAATSCLLGILLARQLGDTNTPVKVYAYAPPPVLSSHIPPPNCTIYCFVNNEDVIPRCSLIEMIRLMGKLAALDAMSSWGVMKRTEILMRGSLSKEEFKEMADAVTSEEASYVSKAEVELYLPGDIYTLKAIPKKPDSGSEKADYKADAVAAVKCVQGWFDSAMKKDSTATSCSSEDSKETVSSGEGITANIQLADTLQYKMFKLTDPAKLFNGQLLTGDRMLSDHRTVSYFTSFYNLSESTFCQ